MNVTLKPLVFATNNEHKVSEIRQQLGDRFNIISLKEAGILVDIPEPYDTLAANASEKSRVILALTFKDCFSEDTGLFVDSLNGEPGVKSARYVEKNEQFDDNMDKLLYKLNKKTNRNAKFFTIISLCLEGREYLFEGECEGIIIHNKKGINGFGYDPIFVPNGSNKTFAEMTTEEKLVFSHRAKAVKKLAGFLNQYYVDC